MATLKQSTTYTRDYLLIKSSDHITGLTGSTSSTTINLSKGGGAFVTTTGVLTELANGWYNIGLTTGDVSVLGDLAYHITATGSDPTDFADQVTANILGDVLPVNVVQWLTTAVTVNLAGVPRVDTDYVSGVTVSTATAQLGVNVVNYNNQVAQTDANKLPIVDTQDINGVSSSTTSAMVGVAVVNIGGAVSAGAAGYVGPDWSHINAPTTAVDLSGTTVKTIDQSNIKKNQANNFSFIMTDSTTHAPKTGVTVTATRSLDGGAFGACANAVSEIGVGWYFIVLAATDTNCNSLALRFTGVSCDDQDITILTQP